MQLCAGAVCSFDHPHPGGASGSNTYMHRAKAYVVSVLLFVAVEFRALLEHAPLRPNTSTSLTNRRPPSAGQSSKKTIAQEPPCLRKPSARLHRVVAHDELRSRAGRTTHLKPKGRGCAEPYGQVEGGKWRQVEFVPKAPLHEHQPLDAGQGVPRQWRIGNNIGMTKISMHCAVLAVVCERSPLNPKPKKRTKLWLRAKFCRVQNHRGHRRGFVLSHRRPLRRSARSRSCHNALREELRRQVVEAEVDGISARADVAALPTSWRGHRHRKRPKRGKRGWRKRASPSGRGAQARQRPQTCRNGHGRERATAWSSEVILVRAALPLRTFRQKHFCSRPHPTPPHHTHTPEGSALVAPRG